MKIRAVEPHEVELVRLFLCANGREHRVEGPAAFARLIQASQRTAVAVNLAGQIVGFARAITDGISNGYLSMVVVASTHRRQGVGRLLVEHVMGTNPGITWVLRAGREGATGFFASLGFSVSTIAMEKPRAQAVVQHDS
jgi:ribosomal protein S18 acetylase RimI-like enzyme